MLRESPPALALALAAALTGCASGGNPGDRAFAAGDYAAAAAAYESALQRDPGARSDPRLLLRLGLAYARPGSAVDEPERALEGLGELVSRFPRDPAAAEATLVLPHLEHEVRLIAALASERRTVADLQGQLARTLEQVHALDAQAATQQEQVARLRTALGEAQAQLRRVREELEQLKRIDLQRRP